MPSNFDGHEQARFASIIFFCKSILVRTVINQAFWVCYYAKKENEGLVLDIAKYNEQQ